MARHHKRFTLVLVVSLALGALVAFVGAPAGWNPDLSIGGVFLILAALTGWAAQNPGRPIPRSRRRRHERPAPSA